ncbi:hypothetical protein HYV57_01775 [Candidatus Peregrinibacteria bacterium]|nr:hypothetical protein [Candidatus Peregrinibacteria bacterium]
MKKIVIVLGFTALLLFAGCAQKQPATDEKSTSGTEEKTDNQISNADTQTKTQTEATTGKKVPRKESKLIAFSNPVPWPSEDVLKGKEDYFKKQLAQDDPNVTDEDVKNYYGGILEISHYWKTGAFISGPYKGQTLVTANIQGCNGPCTSNVYRFAVDETKNFWTILLKYSHNDENWKNEVNRPIDGIDETLIIEEFETPASLPMYPNTKVLLSNKAAMTLANFDEINPESKKTIEEVAYNNPQFDRYFTFQGCLYAVMPDQAVAKYAIVPEEFAENTEPKTSLPFALQKSLTFTDMKGVKTTQEYSIQSGGCGVGLIGCLSLLKPLGNEASELKKIGTIGSHDAYMFDNVSGYIESDSMKILVENTYNSYLIKRQYDETLKNQKELSKNEFIKSNGMVFIKLDNGQYLAMYTLNYEQTAECGKPVIYLYPEKNTVVNVKVGIDTFTKTIPAYGKDGWTVLADPNGSLINFADKKTYPYLFWEGLSDKTFTSSETWTLKRTEVTTELPKSLLNLGLNATEIKDFMEFWGPRILEEKSPYIEFSFVEQKIFDEIAPLAITPKPDTVLRVFMVYRGVNEAGFSAPKYQPVKRRGFTVIEWGGALH